MSLNTSHGRTLIALLVSAAVVPALTTPALALQAPRPLDARTVVISAAGPGEAVALLAGELSEPAWLGYSVPIVDGDHDVCCGVDDRPGVCPLDRRGATGFNRHGESRLDRPAAESLAVFLRLRDGEVKEVRFFDGRCVVDAGGATYYALDDVDPEASVAFLAGLIERWSGDAADEALGAVALHSGDAAGRALESFTASSRPAELRERAAFWIGVTRAAQGLDLLVRMLREDPSPSVREQVAFALYVSEAAESAGLLIDVAREDESPEVRAAALFWLGQTAGERVAGELRDAATRDPDAEVRETAVFALSQLPTDEAVPALIDAARTSRHAEVRRMATFWLGQSGDPRALEFFEELLAR